MSRVPDRAGHRITTVGSITGSANRGSGLAGVLAVMLAALIAVLAPVPAVATASGGPVPSPGHAAASSVATSADTPVVNVFTNGDIEDGSTAPTGWISGGYQPQNASFTWDSTIRHAGARSLGIDTGAIANDVRWTQDFTVPAPPPGSTVHRCRLSGWIKTEGVTGGYGASLGNADTFAENDESFTLQLDDAVNAFLADGTATGTVINDDLPLEGLADPSLAPLMTALSGVILDGTGKKVIGLAPPCAMTGSYLGLSDIDKLSQSIQANDGCLQFVTVFGGQMQPREFCTVVPVRCVVSCISLPCRSGSGSITTSSYPLWGL
jgi:hypothetical protein